MWRNVFSWNLNSLASKGWLPSWQSWNWMIPQLQRSTACRKLKNLAIVGVLPEDFGGHVLLRSANLSEELGFVEQSAEAEVNDFQRSELFIFLENQVV